MKKKHKKKQLLAIVLSLIMIISSYPNIYTSAAETDILSDQVEVATETDAEMSEGEIVIESEETEDSIGGAVVFASGSYTDTSVSSNPTPLFGHKTPSDVVKAAKKYIGVVPYKMGGTTTAGWDCGGYVRYVMNNDLGVSPKVTVTSLAEYIENVRGIRPVLC